LGIFVAVRRHAPLPFAGAAHRAPTPSDGHARPPAGRTVSTAGLSPVSGLSGCLPIGMTRGTTARNGHTENSRARVPNQPANQPFPASMRQCMGRLNPQAPDHIVPPAREGPPRPATGAGMGSPPALRPTRRGVPARLRAASSEMTSPPPPPVIPAGLHRTPCRPWPAPAQTRPPAPLTLNLQAWARGVREVPEVAVARRARVHKRGLRWPESEFLFALPKPRSSAAARSRTALNSAQLAPTSPTCSPRSSRSPPSRP
jgi:hypothetical protein